MKHLVPRILIVSALVLGLSACNNGGGSSTNANAKFNIGFSISARDQFLSTMETAALNAKAEDVNIQTFDAENDFQKQLSHVESAVTNKFDAMIINCVNTDEAETLIKAAGDMPVVFVNRFPDESLLVKDKVVYVGSDEAVAGRMQGEWVAEHFKDSGKKEIKYVMLQGILGLSNTTARTDGAIEAIKKGGFEPVEAFRDTAEWDRVKGMEKMQAFLGTGKEFDVVISNNDEMALGAYEAMSAVNKLGAPILGIDATSNALLAIEEDKMAVSVFQDADGQGKGAYDQAIRLAEKKSSDDTITWIPFELVTKDNIKDYK